MYRNRTLGPYRAALPWVKEDAPHLYALPGNHDWYDSLTSFTRLFCQERWFGGWKTRQSNSYFAIQLPHNWWFFAVDIQLGADIDKPQRDYFDSVVCGIREGDKVIFASATPSWIMESLTGDASHDNIAFMEKRIHEQKAKIYVNVAGDLHHYAHYTNEDESRHKFTAGGGGAFLHGTHHMPKKIEVNEATGKNDYSLTEEGLYPNKETSRSLLKGCFMSCFRNWSLSLFIGFYYLLTLWVTQSVSLSLGENLLKDLEQVSPSLLVACQSLPLFGKLLVQSPASSFLFLTLLLALICFCEPFPSKGSKSTWIKRIVLGGVHGVLHILLITSLLPLLVLLNSFLTGGIDSHTLNNILLSLEIITIGSFLSGLLMGVYLYLSNILFKAHSEAAFSCSRIENYKNFLRFHIDKTGKLTIYPMGIEKIEKNWVLNTQGNKGDTWFNPKYQKPMSDYVHLIEEPIIINTTYS